MRTLLALLLLILAGCAGGGSTQGKPTGKVRVANFVVVNGAAGTAFDVYAAPYDGFTKLDPNAKPLFSNVQFGKVTDYVSPPATQNSGVFSFFETGKRTAGDLYPGTVPGSFKEGDQAMETVTSRLDTGGRLLVEFGTLWENGPTEKVNPLDRPAAGKAMFYEYLSVRDPALDGKIFWWGVGGPCLVSGTSQAARGYEIPAGRYNLTLLIKPGGTGDPTCQEPPTLTLPIDASADARAWIVIWGTSANDLHLMWLPIP
jgi:hypothetical protein